MPESCLCMFSVFAHSSPTHTLAVVLILKMLELAKKKRATAQKALLSNRCHDDREYSRSDALPPGRSCTLIAHIAPVTVHIAATMPMASW
eukprot:CAMPEP_0181517466 /NCGR_PEP_ID=MMETSP1110-20121109/64731_1 /TAXON_ID=174948 /ORGANISM="Symbiodinium sp., Strain CCMP421" /LENGTH=89 /DNA_ID=CAMNT_0023647769 /DNA_START=242 /DNA_END=511 /DNA_ORIENTATION=+